MKLLDDGRARLDIDQLFIAFSTSDTSNSTKVFSFLHKIEHTFLQIAFFTSLVNKMNKK